MNAPIVVDQAPADAIGTTEAAALVHVKRQDLVKWITAGKLRAWRNVLTGKYRVSRADVLAILQPVVVGKKGAPLTATETRRRRVWDQSVLRPKRGIRTCSGD